MKDHLKIIHIVENLDKGAVENLLVNTFIETRKIRADWEWTFYCILGKEGQLDKKVKDAGGKIIYSPCTLSHKTQFLKALRTTLKKGHYDIIHSHHDYLSGFYLLATRGIKFKKRILHIHNNEKGLPVENKLLRKILLKPLRLLGIHFSDCIVGISKHTLKEFTRSAKFRKKETVVLYSGIDLAAFETASGNEALLAELGLPAAAKLLLYGGRMNKNKNPAFIVDILALLLQKERNYFALFVGEGGEISEIEKRAAANNITPNIKILGWRKDIPALMKAADVFVFPRFEQPQEGLGLVVLEAQAAGLPMVLSTGVPEDAIEVQELATFVRLNNNPGEWADRIAAIKKLPVKTALEKMQRSRFALNNAAENLVRLYECCA